MPLLNTITLTDDCHYCLLKMLLLHLTKTAIRALATHANTNHISSQHIKLLCKQGELKEALQILKVTDYPFDAFTYIHLLQTCVKKRSLSHGKLIHAHILETGFLPNIYLWNTLVNIYAKCGSLADARRVFDRMPERDTFSWTVMISAYAAHCSAAAPSMHGRGETARKRAVGPSGWTDMASRGVSEAEEGQIWQPFSQTNCDRDERQRVSQPAHCIRHGGHAPSRLPAQVTTANEGDKTESLGFKDVGRYFIPANRSEGHVGYMRAHAADLAARPIQNLFSVKIPPLLIHSCIKTWKIYLWVYCQSPILQIKSVCKLTKTPAY
jgi:pentatricopeptide repeat protein